MAPVQKCNTSAEVFAQEGKVLRQCKNFCTGAYKALVFAPIPLVISLFFSQSCENLDLTAGVNIWLPASLKNFPGMIYIYKYVYICKYMYRWMNKQKDRKAEDQLAYINKYNEINEEL